MEYEREDLDREEYNEGRACYKAGNTLPNGSCRQFKEGYAWEKRLVEVYGMGESNE